MRGVKVPMNDEIQKKIKKYLPCILIAVACLVIAIGLLVFPIGQQAPKKLDLSEYSSINSICELATLRSFYHNVVVYEVEPSDGVKTISKVFLWPFDQFFKPGYKQYWMEYSGIVETGIDASQIRINDQNGNGIVEVYVPDAKILSVYADENSLSKPLTENGLGTTITGEEQARAFATAQGAMRTEAENDRDLMMRTKNNAKILLEQYIKNTGKVMGVAYTVKWVDHPK